MEPQNADLRATLKHKRIGPLIWAVILAYSLLITCLFLCGEAVCDGHFSLNISLHSRSSKAIRNVRCAFSFRREEAEWLSQTDDPAEDYQFKAVEGFDGTKCVAYGRCSWRKSWGIEHHYVADQSAVIWIDYANGKRFKTVVEIPKVRGPRSVTVEVP
jgi:hypothetical protein